MPANGAAAIAAYFDAATVAAGYSDVCSGATTAAQIVNVTAVVAGDNCGWTVDFTYDVIDDCNPPNTLTGETYQDVGEDQTDPVADGTLDPARLDNLGNSSAMAGTAVVVNGQCEVVINVSDIVDASTDTDNCTDFSTSTTAVFEIRDPSNAASGNGIGSSAWGSSCLLYTSPSPRDRG